MIWRFRPAVAIPLSTLCLAAVVGGASLLSEFMKQGSWKVAFSSWVFRRWESQLILIGAATVISFGLWGIQTFLKK